jgi:hypothetical protein
VLITEALALNLGLLQVVAKISGPRRRAMISQNRCERSGLGESNAEAIVQLTSLPGSFFPSTVGTEMNARSETNNVRFGAWSFRSYDACEIPP